MKIDWDIFLEIHKDMPRQGSGRDEYTQKAFELIPEICSPKILDIGCGPGMQTIKLAKLSHGEVIGIDIHEQYLDQLRELIAQEDLMDRVRAEKQSMFELNYPSEYFDIIWAEGSIFIIGFEKGLLEWKKFIKPKGFLAIHEMTWLKDNPPKEIKDYWARVYPSIATIPENIKLIKKSGYKLLGYFSLPDDAWWEFYYHPLQTRLKTLKITYKHNPVALEMIAEAQLEIDLFKKYNQYYGSVFYVMQNKSL
jgi:ubiquinone/menaquinone biosynthesis C-methylase UbiE